MFKCIFSVISLVVLICGSNGATNAQRVRKAFKHQVTNANLIGIYRTLVKLEGLCGFTPSAVLDVGANSGEWSADLQRYFPDSTFFLIEGSQANAAAIERKLFKYAITLVGDEDKEIKFYQRPFGETGNAIFKEAHWNESTAVISRMRRIDDIIAEQNVGPFNFMKMDIQGSEVLALKGAVKTLKHVEVIAVEAAIMNYNVGGASFFDLHQQLETLGFALFDITDMMRRKDIAVQADLVFVRKTSRLWRKQCTGFPPREDYKSEE